MRVGVYVDASTSATEPGACAAGNPRPDAAAHDSSRADQDGYLRALAAGGSVDHIEYGTYVTG
ncbi:MAG: hypothetical protein ACRDPO_11685 [Streptosporangiaceae bacterium]